MRNIHAFLAVCWLLFTLFLLAGCGGSSEPAAAGDTMQPPEAGILQSPADIARSISGDADVSALGSDYRTDCFCQMVETDGTAAVFTPTAGDPPKLEDMAVAVYTLSLPMLLAEKEVVLDWLEAPDPSQLWVGVSDWDNNCWVFRSSEDAGRVEFGNLAGYVSGTGQLLVVVTLGGTDSATLHGLTVPSSHMPPIWSMFGGDAQHTRRSTELGPDNCDNVWSVYHSFQEANTRSAAIGANGTIYIGDNGGKLFAINPDGSQLWEYSTVSPVRSTPVIAADGTIYVHTVSGAFTALSPAGEMLWVNNLPFSNDYSPAISPDGTIYCSTLYGSSINAITPDGSSTEFFNRSFNSPAFGPGGQIYAVTSGTLYSFNGDGTVNWTNDDAGYGRSVAVGSDGEIYLAGKANNLIAVNENGTPRWSCSLGGTVRGAPALAESGTIYIGCEDANRFYAIKPTGNVKWVFEGDSAFNPSPVIDGDGTIYTACQTGIVYAFNPDGTVKWSYDTNVAIYDSPSIGLNGSVYISAVNKLYAFQR